MKKLMFLLALTASVWSSFLYASKAVYVSRVSEQNSTYNRCALAPSICYQTFYVDDELNSDEAYTQRISELVPIVYNGNNCTFNGSRFMPCENVAMPIYMVFQVTLSDIEPDESCQSAEGAFIDGLHNSQDDFCANVGSTGGTNPQPLLCIARWLIETPTGSGNWQHTVTSESCSSPTGPVSGNDPCTENCEPTDPDTGGGDGSNIPGTGDSSSSSKSTVTGTSTDSQGNVTNIELEIEQDLTPVTERLNEANKRLEVENKNSSAMLDKLKDILDGITGNGEKLDGIKDAISNQQGTDLSGVEDKLDDIKGAIDGLKDGAGTFEDGQSAGEGVQLPDYNTALTEGFDRIQSDINSDVNNATTKGLSEVGKRFTAFDSLPQLFEFAAENCEPIRLDQTRSLNLCGYAPTISNTLSWLFTMLTVIFLLSSVVADVKNMRLNS